MVDDRYQAIKWKLSNLIRSREVPHCRDTSALAELLLDPAQNLTALLLLERRDCRTVL